MKFWLTLSLSVLASAILLSILPIYGEAAIYDDVLRLHVLAQSDSDADQAQKLAVRDAVLACVAEAVDGCATFEEAYATVATMQDELTAVAQDTAANNGQACGVRVTLGREDYPRRTYEGMSLPAGNYPSLRILLGAGTGKNWWCILFPTVCVPYAEAEEALAVSLTPEEYRIITGAEGKWQVRFRILEWFAALFGDGTTGT